MAQSRAGTQTLAKYQYEWIDDKSGVTHHGTFVETSPGTWQERTDSPVIPTYFFNQIPGDKDWVTLFDSSRDYYVRFLQTSAGPLQLKTSSDPHATWGVLRSITPVIVASSERGGEQPRKTGKKPNNAISQTLQVAVPLISKEVLGVSPTPTPAPSPTPTPTQKATWSDKQVATAFGISGVMVMLLIAFFFRYPTPFQYTVFRIVLALVGAGVGATIPGLLDVNVSGVVRASGAIAVFVIVYFLKPTELVAHNPLQTQQPRAVEPSPPSSTISTSAGDK